METKYLPKTMDGKLARLAEECAEVIQVVCKIQRFGIDNHHPVTGVDNIDLLLAEMADLVDAVDVVNKSILEKVGRENERVSNNN